MIKRHGFFIDPQNDFCYPGYDVFANEMGIPSLSNASSYMSKELYNEGSLYVPGAFQDMKRLEEMIRRIGDKLYDIHVTLDTHHHLDIAHPSF